MTNTMAQNKKLTHNQRIGKWGEQIAAEYLEKKGYTILEKNCRTPHGEIDLVTMFEGITILVEVKTRTSGSFGLPEEGLTNRKIAHMRTCAEYYAGIHGLDTWQCDAVAVQGKPGTTPSLEHFENVT